MKKNIWKKEIGTVQNIGNSVKEIKGIRKKLSKVKLNLKEINNL